MNERRMTYGRMSIHGAHTVVLYQILITPHTITAYLVTIHPIDLCTVTEGPSTPFATSKPYQAYLTDAPSEESARRQHGRNMARIGHNDNLAISLSFNKKNSAHLNRLPSTPHLHASVQASIESVSKKGKRTRPRQQNKIARCPPTKRGKI